nr:probable leucine-rich repeat receptor-like protein kinase At1g35710 [Ipomoea batatas]
MGNFGWNHAALIFLVVSCFFAWETIASTTTEAEALLKWKTGLSMGSFPLKSWSLSNLRNLCNWTGIVCNAGGAVSQINLPFADLYGTLHHLNFTSFPSLTRFNIIGNYFDGSIPPAIGDLSNLVFLDLSDNWFDGSIPPQIWNLTELQHLDLSINIISGVIPHQIGNLQKILSKNLKFAEGVPMVKSSKALKDVQPELEKLRQKSISKLTAGDQASRRRPTTEWARVEASDWTTVVSVSLASAGWWAVARQSIEPNYM